LPRGFATRNDGMDTDSVYTESKRHLSAKVLTNLPGVHTMTEYKTIAIDLAKRNFHIVALNEIGKKVFATKCSRGNLLLTFSKGSTIAMEACGGSNYWARTLEKEGFKCILLKTHDVKPYAKTRQKNDTNDALAIAKAALDRSSACTSKNT
jgi:hypothetical protein